MKAKRLAANVRFLVIEQVATYVLPLAVLPYLFRVIGPEKYGLIAVAQALVVYAIIITDYGFNWSATHKIAQSAKDRTAIARIATSVFLIKASLMVLALAAIALIAILFPSLRIDPWLLASCFLAVLGSVMFPVWLFQGLQRMREMVLCSLTGRATTLVAILFLVKSPSDFRIAAALLSANGVVSGMIAIFAMRIWPNPFGAMPTKHELKAQLAGGWHLFISNVSITLYSNTNVLVLGLMTHPAAVGQFAAAEKIVRAATALLSPVSQAAFPHIADIIVESRAKALSAIRSMLTLQVSIALALTLILFALANQLVNVISGPQFSDTATLVRMMAMFPVFVALSNVFGVQTMVNFGMAKSFSRILLCAGIINLVLLVLLVPTMVSKGAALSLVASEGMVTLMMAYSLMRVGLLSPLLRKGGAASVQ